MTRILYYLILLPLSRLPLSVLYRLSNGLYVLLYRWIGYRQEVVFGNLSRAFPEKSKEETESIASDFYRHFCDLIFESVRLFSMPKEELIERAVVTNPEFIEPFYEQGKSVLIVAGHYGSWEMLGTAMGHYTKHTSMGIYSPIKNEFLNQAMAESRSKCGIELVSTRKVRQWFADNTHRAVAVMFGADQSPSSRKKTFWMEFLNQETAIAFGTEKFAKQYNYPVVFGDIQKVSRGYYTLTFSLVTADPSKEADGEITRKHTQILEKVIRKEPRYWLWTHRRWKRNRQREEAEALAGKAE